MIGIMGVCKLSIHSCLSLKKRKLLNDMMILAASVNLTWLSGGRTISVFIIDVNSLASGLPPYPGFLHGIPYILITKRLFENPKTLS